MSLGRWPKAVVEGQWLERVMTSRAGCSQEQTPPSVLPLGLP